MTPFFKVDCHWEILEDKEGEIGESYASSWLWLDVISLLYDAGRVEMKLLLTGWDDEPVDSIGSVSSDVDDSSTVLHFLTSVESTDISFCFSFASLCTDSVPVFSDSATGESVIAKAGLGILGKFSNSESKM